jgi:hypothetical protein
MVIIISNRQLIVQFILNQFLIATLDDPPKSPLKRGTLNLVPPFLRGARGERQVLHL